MRNIYRRTSRIHSGFYRKILIASPRKGAGKGKGENMGTTTTSEMVKRIVKELNSWIEKGYCTIDNCENMIGEYIDDHIINIDPAAKVYIIEKSIRSYKG